MTTPQQAASVVVAQQAALAPALAAMNAAIAAASPLQYAFGGGTLPGIPPGQLMAAADMAANNAVAVFEAFEQTCATIIDTVNLFGVSSSIPAPMLPAIFIGQTAAVQLMSYANTTANYLERISINLSEATG